MYGLFLRRTSADDISLIRLKRCTNWEYKFLCLGLQYPTTRIIWRTETKYRLQSHGTWLAFLIKSIRTAPLQSRDWIHQLKASKYKWISQFPSSFNSDTTAARTSSVIDSGPHVTTAKGPRRLTTESCTRPEISGRECVTLRADGVRMMSLSLLPVTYLD